MEVTFVGTGALASLERFNTSVLIDNILFDCGNGTIKQLNRLKISIPKIRYVVITHFHIDHTFDIPNLLAMRLLRKEMDDKLTFIGPKGLRDRLIALATLAYADGFEEKYKNIEQEFNIDFIELDDGESFETEEYGFKLTAYKLDHGLCKEEQGYILEKESKKIGILWDTTFCDSYEKICQNVDIALSDVAKEETTKAHIGIKEFKEFYKKYPNVKFYAIHRSDYIIPECPGVVFPQDGDKTVF